MLTILITATTAALLVIATALIAVLTGWFPRLAAVTARVIDLYPSFGGTTRLDPRERSELLARLWVPL